MSVTLSVPSIVSVPFTTSAQPYIPYSSTPTENSLNCRGHHPLAMPMYAVATNALIRRLPRSGMLMPLLSICLRKWWDYFGDYNPSKAPRSTLRMLGALTWEQPLTGISDHIDHCGLDVSMQLLLLASFGLYF